VIWGSPGTRESEAGQSPHLQRPVCSPRAPQRISTEGDPPLADEERLSDVQRLGRWLHRTFVGEPQAGRHNGQTQRPGIPAEGDIAYLVARGDSYPEHVRSMAERAQLHRLVMGTNDHHLAMTEPRRNLLILGPPRSEKTAGVLALTILSHPGPVVSTSTKADVLRATGLIRARLGRVWHYSPDGSETPPGCTELRWSPIPPSVKWSTAIALGKAMADVAETGGGTQDVSYFRVKAGVAIAALLHAAALGNKRMLWLLRAVNGDRRILEEAGEILDGSLSADSQIAASDLQGILDLDERSRGAIFATTANALAAYRLPGALRSVEYPNFDPAAFVAGDPMGYNPLRVSPLPPEAEHMDTLRWQLSQKGRFDTVYITASSEQQNLVAPIVAGFLSQIRQAAFARHRADEENDYFTRPAVLWALDEIAGIAPMRDLPEMTLSQSGGQGLLVAVCLQDLSLARAKWDKAADAFLTLFGNVVVHAGIRDDATLRAISTVIGQHWVEVVAEGTTQSEGRGYGGRNSGESVQQTSTRQLVARLEPGAISQGRVMEHPHFVLGLTPKGWAWFYCMPYYSAPPWPQMLVANMEYVAARANLLEAWLDIPTPILDRDGSGQCLIAAGGPELLERYRTARQKLKEQGARRAELLARIGDDSLLAGYDDGWTVRLPAPVRCFIALRTDPGRAKIASTLEMLRGELRPAKPGEEIVITDAHNVLGRPTPMGDLPESVFFHPEWVMGVTGSRAHRAGLSIVEGGVSARSRATPIERFGDQIPHTAVLMEAWCMSRPVAHMVMRVAEKLQAIAPACFLEADGARHFGPWQLSVECRRAKSWRFSHTQQEDRGNRAARDTEALRRSRVAMVTCPARPGWSDGGEAIWEAPNWRRGLGGLPRDRLITSRSSYCFRSSMRRPEWQSASSSLSFRGQSTASIWRERPVSRSESGWWELVSSRQCPADRRRLPSSIPASLDPSAASWLTSWTSSSSTPDSSGRSGSTCTGPGPTRSPRPSFLIVRMRTCTSNTGPRALRPLKAFECGLIPPGLLHLKTRRPGDGARTAARRSRERRRPSEPSAAWPWRNGCWHRSRRQPR
jgi:type IV secretion system protein VirD4